MKQIRFENTSRNALKPWQYNLLAAPGMFFDNSNKTGHIKEQSRQIFRMPSDFYEIVFELSFSFTSQNTHRKMQNDTFGSLQLTEIILSQFDLE